MPTVSSFLCTDCVEKSLFGILLIEGVFGAGGAQSVTRMSCDLHYSERLIVAGSRKTTQALFTVGFC